MTASSIGLFACRVQPMGLPTGGAATTGSVPFNRSSSRMSVRQAEGEEQHQQNHHQVSTRPIRPTTAAARRVSRNLFGKPDHGEIGKILRNEYDRNCTYVRERYNFDIRTAKPPNSEEKIEEMSATDKPLPTLIAQELEEQLQSAKRQKKCNNLNKSSNNNNNNNNNNESSSNFTTAERTPQAATTGEVDTTPRTILTSAICKEGLTTSATPTSCNNHPSNQKKLSNGFIKQQQKQIINNIALCNTIAGGDNERLKTIVKQTLITDCFNARKSATLNGKHIKRQHENREVLPEILHTDSDPVTIDHDSSLTKSLADDRKAAAANVLLSLQITATTADSLHA